MAAKPEIPAKAVFVISCGRCSTQFLARTLRHHCPDAIVDHEGLRANYYSRRIFRKPRRIPALFSVEPRIKAKFKAIETALDSNIRYIDTGWPVFAWVPYLADRLGSNLEIVHVVRSPFENAASLCAQGAFVATDNRYFSENFVHGTDHKLHYKDIATRWKEFSPFEKTLFHWLELNRFAKECHNLPGFKGMFRFEDLFSRESPGIHNLCSILAGRDLGRVKTRPFDNAHKHNELDLEKVDAGLLQAVCELAASFGYDVAALRKSLQSGEVARKYSAARIETGGQ